jgi:hypothetical protein
MRTITFKASDQEYEALNWFVDRAGFKSGSAAIREAIVMLAKSFEAFPNEVLQAMEFEPMLSRQAVKRRPRSLGAEDLFKPAEFVPVKIDTPAVSVQTRLEEHAEKLGLPVSNTSEKVVVRQRPKPHTGRMVPKNKRNGAAKAKAAKPSKVKAKKKG